jgi:hypothetical protein
MADIFSHLHASLTALTVATQKQVEANERLTAASQSMTAANQQLTLVFQDWAQIIDAAVKAREDHDDLRAAVVRLEALVKEKLGA